jgi:glycosyltransferase involved in cell wall biosynthesis
MSNLHPNLSVVVCTRNRAAALETTLNSIFSQDVPASEYEVVVVDDGSTDPTPDVVAKFGGDVVYVRQEHAGLAAARNEGAARSQGDLICYVDDDIEADPSWLREVTAGAARNPDASCLAGRILVRYEGDPPRTCEREYIAANLDAGDSERPIDRAVGANMAVRRSALDDVGPFDETLRWQWDEVEWQERLRARDGRIVYLPAALVWHRRTAAELRRWRLLVDRFRWGRCYPVYARRTGRPTPIWPELRHLVISLVHGVRRRCFGGPLMAFYRLGVLTSIARNALAERIPALRPAARFSRGLRHSPRNTALQIATTRGSTKGRFARIHAGNVWQGSDSRSGPGSSLEETRVVRRELGPLLERIGARVLLDIPCGDFHWMKETVLPIDTYIGADLIDRIVDANKLRYGSEQRRFVRLDITRDDLPLADVVLCRDGLDHLSLEDAKQALANIKRSGAQFLLATTYPERARNGDIRTGDWRPLNLERAPFDLPPPIEMLNEGSLKPGFSDKSLGLWRVDDLPVER